MEVECRLPKEMARCLFFLGVKRHFLWIYLVGVVCGYLINQLITSELNGMWQQ